MSVTGWRGRPNECGLCPMVPKVVFMTMRYATNAKIVSHGIRTARDSLTVVLQAALH